MELRSSNDTTQHPKQGHETTPFRSYDVAGVEFGGVLGLELVDEAPVADHRLAQRHVEVARHLLVGGEAAAAAGEEEEG